MREHTLPTVVVVGAAGGIGLQVVKQLRAKAQVIAVVQDEAQQAQLKSLAVLCLSCNLADAASVSATLAQLQAQWTGPVHGLVVCAAMQPVGPLELFGRADLERLFAVNVFGGFQFVQGLIPRLRQTRGRVVLYSSMAGRVAAPVLGGYAASKFALEALADTLRRELLPAGIQVSLVEPGGVQTPMADAQAALVQQLQDRLEGPMKAHYSGMLRGYAALASAALKHASTADAAAAAAVRAVLGPGRAKPRYVVGLDAKMTILLSRLLPVTWLDALLSKLQDVLKGTPPPWLRKALTKGEEKSFDFEDDEEVKS